jgi:hypothetical protein
MLRAAIICPELSCNSRAIRRLSSSCERNSWPESVRRASSARFRWVMSRMALVTTLPSSVSSGLRLISIGIS